MPRKSCHPIVRAKTIGDAWESIASTATLAGKTLAQYRNTVSASQDLRDELDALIAQVRGKREEIIAADAVTRDLNKKVVAAVRADPAHGSDSPLLAAMDYVTDSERKSGKTNKKNGNGNGNGQP